MKHINYGIIVAFFVAHKMSILGHRDKDNPIESIHEGSIGGAESLVGWSSKVLRRLADTCSHTNFCCTTGDNPCSSDAGCISIGPACTVGGTTENCAPLA
jgi:hypothetical protein